MLMNTIKTPASSMQMYTDDAKEHVSPPSTMYYARCTQLASHKLCVGSVMNMLKRDLGTGNSDHTNL